MMRIVIGSIKDPLRVHNVYTTMVCDVLADNNMKRAVGDCV